MEVNKENIEKLVVIQRGLVVDGVTHHDGREIDPDELPDLFETFLEHLPEKRFVVDGEREFSSHYVRIILEESEEESEEQEVEEGRPPEDDLDDMLKDELVDLADKEEVGTDDLDLKDDYLKALKDHFGYEYEQEG